VTARAPFRSAGAARTRLAIAGDDAEPDNHPALRPRPAVLVLDGGSAHGVW